MAATKSSPPALPWNNLNQFLYKLSDEQWHPGNLFSLVSPSQAWKIPRLKNATPPKSGNSGGIAMVNANSAPVQLPLTTETSKVETIYRAPPEQNLLAAALGGLIVLFVATSFIITLS